MTQTRTLTDSTVRRPAAGFSGPPLTLFSSLNDPSKTGGALSSQTAEIFSHCGFQRILFTFEADAAKQLVGLTAILDIYYVGDPDNGAGAVKIGRVSYNGKLVRGSSAYGKPEWKVSMASSCLYDRSNAGDLPALVQEVGPGAFMTGVTQTLLGTAYGQELLGLKGYTVPDCR
jgi:hypothetical protein